MANPEMNERLLFLLQILHEETDEAHMLTTGELVDSLAGKGVACSRKSVAGDLALLTDMGADILAVDGREKRYFIAERRFEVPEIRLLIDAVGSSRFITAKKSAALIEKLKALTSRHLAETLHQHLYAAERVKTSNKAVYYTVDAGSTAIDSGRGVTFQYIEYTPDKEAVCKHNGKVYAFSPYDVMWSDDRYSAVG